MREFLERPVSVNYQVLRSNEQWEDHIARTFVTAGLIAWQKPFSIIDPAAGDGSIVMAANSLRPIGEIRLGDISHPSCVALKSIPIVDEVYEGDIYEHIESLGDKVFDMAVLTETIEHVERPGTLLYNTSHNAKYLVASSPAMRPGQIDDNPEHLWMFDLEGYRGLLENNGWTPLNHTVMYFPQYPYDFQIWVARSKSR